MNVLDVIVHDQYGQPTLSKWSCVVQWWLQCSGDFSILILIGWRSFCIKTRQLRRPYLFCWSYQEEIADNLPSRQGHNIRQVIYGLLLLVLMMLVTTLITWITISSWSSSEYYANGICVANIWNAVSRLVIGLILSIINVFIVINTKREKEGRTELLCGAVSMLAFFVLSTVLEMYHELYLSQMLTLCSWLMVALITSMPALHHAFISSLQASRISQLKNVKTFRDVIEIDSGYDAFMDFLRTEFSEENLLFWKKATEFEEKTEQIEREIAQASDKGFTFRKLANRSPSQLSQKPPSTDIKATDQNGHELTLSAERDDQLMPVHKERDMATGYSHSKEEVKPGNKAVETLAADENQANLAYEQPECLMRTRAASMGTKPTKIETSSSMEQTWSTPITIRLPTFLSEKAKDISVTEREDALKKLRRISWCVCLDRAASNRIERKLLNHQSAMKALAPSISPRKPVSTPRMRISPRSRTLSSRKNSTESPAHGKEKSSTPSSPKNDSKVPFFPSGIAATSSMNSVPFMQSIVRALQATSRGSTSKKETAVTFGERRSRGEPWMQEPREVRVQRLVKEASELFDQFIARSAIQQVNLPDAIVKVVIERMRELLPSKYGQEMEANQPLTPSQHMSKPTAFSTFARRPQVQANRMQPSGSMRTKIGLVRSATMRFFASKALANRIAPAITDGVPDALTQEPAYQIKSIFTRNSDGMDPCLSFRQHLALQTPRELSRKSSEHEVFTDLSKLTFPLSDLFRASHEAIEQLMQKDSFKRFLSSSQFQTFHDNYTKVPSAGKLMRQPSRSRLHDSPRVHIQTSDVGDSNAGENLSSRQLVDSPSNRRMALLPVDSPPYKQTSHRNSCLVQQTNCSSPNTRNLPSVDSSVFDHSNLTQSSPQNLMQINALIQPSTAVHDDHTLKASSQLHSHIHHDRVISVSFGRPLPSTTCSVDDHNSLRASNPQPISVGSAKRRSEEQQLDLIPPTIKPSFFIPNSFVETDDPHNGNDAHDTHPSDAAADTSSLAFPPRPSLFAYSHRLNIMREITKSGESLCLRLSS